MRRGNYFLNRLWGPIGSVLLHIFLFIILVKVLIFHSPEKEQTVDVQVVKNLENKRIKPKEVEEKLAEPPQLKNSSHLEKIVPNPTVSKERISPEMKLNQLNVETEIKHPLVLTGVLAGRTEEQRATLLREFGGKYGADAERAVVRGLDWLKKEQNKNGSWGVGRSRSMTARQERVRLTGLALLAYLAHGETMQSEKYGETVTRAIEYLLSEQQKNKGRFCPFSKTVGSHDDIGVYGHAIATYALAEAYSLTRAPFLLEPVMEGAKVILEGQQENGGWDHRYQHAKWSDLSVTGWQVQALRAVEIAGIKVQGLEAALKKSNLFVQKMYEGEGQFYYRIGNKKPSRGLEYMTGVAVLCLQLSGEKSVDELQNGLAYLRVKPCLDWEEGWQRVTKNRSFNIAYEWYYNTQALFQKGGGAWTRWNSRFAPMLIQAQQDSGAWKPPSELKKEISKDIIYTTDFCILSLEVYYRILPSFKTKKATKKQQFVFDDVVRVKVFNK